MSLIVSSGIHTIQVSRAAGYLLEEDPAQAGQIENPSSYLYGNPKAAQVEEGSWRCAVFQFIPYVEASTASVIRDRRTGERLLSAAIAFRVTSGILSNFVYDGYPMNAVYKSNWYSRPDGTFPTNIWLPAMNYNLTLLKTNYCDGVFTNVIVNPPPGQVTNLGTLWLSPVDANTNGLADSWEEQYFRGGAPVPPNEDPDGDGHNNKEEYRLGTDPTNRDSVLKLHIAVQNADGFLFTWPVANGRTYKIQTFDRLTSELWTPTLFGFWEAAYGQTQMQCIVTNAIDQTNRFYRLAVPVP